MAEACNHHSVNILLHFFWRLLILLVWVASIGFVYWDVYRRDLQGRQQLAWLAVVALLPVIGFVIYLFARFILTRFPVGAPNPSRKSATQPMHLPQKEVIPAS
jgi:hypothetical protein